MDNLKDLEISLRIAYRQLYRQELITFEVYRTMLNNLTTLLEDYKEETNGK